LGEEELEELKDTLSSGWLTTGPKSEQFERALKSYLGCRNVVAVASCTAALHLSLIASDIGPGDEVILPDIAFMSNAGVVELVRARPVLADIDPETLTMSVPDLKRRITRRTKAVMPVHLAGHPCELDEIIELAEERGLVVIQDAAHAISAEYKNKKIGAIGSITCFSFHAIKNITGGEGGAIATSDDELAEKTSRLRLFGISERQMIELGYKYNMSELHAALCLAQLKKLSMFQRRREEIVHQYYEAFSDNKFVNMPAVKPYVRHAWHLFIIRLRLEHLKCSRDGFRDQLATENIGSQVHFQPIHTQPYFANRFQAAEYPNTCSAYQRILSIPLYPKMTDSDASDVIAALELLLERNKVTQQHSNAI
jgi:dTDP-4-amino-4,6-dideoxygalactose transaminase